MKPPAPNESLPANDDAGEVVAARKSRSAKQILLTGVTFGVITVGVVGLLGGIVWLVRRPLAETTIEGFFASKGISADIQIDKLQLGTAQIRNVRIGSTDKPTFTTRSGQLVWHYNKRAKILAIDRLEIDGATINIALDKTGKVDFGALKPLMTPSTGRKVTSIDGVRVTNLAMTMATPEGPAKALLSLTGGERAGWLGRADITPPEKFIAQGRAFTPLRVGFAARAVAKSAPDPITEIGFYIAPAGQSLTYLNHSVLGLTGTVAGRVEAAKTGKLQIDTRRSSLDVVALRGPSLNVGPTNLQIEPIFWHQGRSWATSGWGSGGVIGSFATLNVSAPLLKVQTGRFSVRAARSDGGRMQADFVADALGVNGLQRVQRIQIAGNVSTLAKDLTALAENDFQGRTNLVITKAAIPQAATRSLRSGLPQPFADIVNGSVSMQTALRYVYARGNGQISLDGPLLLTGASGARATWTNERGPTPAFLFSAKKGEPFSANVVGSGRLGVTIPRFGDLSANLDGITFGEQGLAMVGRSALAQLYGPTSVRARLDRFELRAPIGSTLSGRVAGDMQFDDQSNRANLAFNAAGDANRFKVTAAGPVAGFGAVTQRGRINLDVSAIRQGENWQFTSVGRLAASGLARSGFELTGTDVNLTAVGRLIGPTGPTPSLAAIMTLNGAASGARGGNNNVAVGLRDVRFNTVTNLTGNINRLQLGGQLTGSASRLGASALVFEDTNLSLQYGGVLNGGGLAVHGKASGQLGRVSQFGRGVESRHVIDDTTLEGPFQANIGQVNSNTPKPFWNGALILASPTVAVSVSADLKSRAQRVAFGANRLNGLTISGPLTIDRRANGQWVGDGRLAGAMTSANLGDMRVSDVRLSGPVSAILNSSNRQPNIRVDTDLDLTARTFKSGETGLSGLAANGRLSVSSTGDTGTVITAPSCLNFGAQSGVFPGDARSSGSVRGRLCPDNAGQIARLTASGAEVLASANLQPLSIRMGSVEAGQTFDIGDVTGTFTNLDNGRINLSLLATQFGLGLKMPDGSTATVKANEAALDIVPNARGIGLKGRLGQVSAIGLPVFISGGASADFLVGPRGLTGTFDFDDLLITDVEKLARFGALKVKGSGILAGNQVSIVAQALEPPTGIKLAELTFGHDIASGSGSLDIAASDLLFSPRPVGTRQGLELAALLPPLRGVVTDMKGTVDATANFNWSRDQPIKSSATIETKNLDFLIELGTVDGVAGKIQFDDLLTARTQGSQTVQVGMLNTGGIPIENGVVQFALPGNNTLRLEDASWPFAEGKLSVRPATWTFRDGDQAFAIDVDDVDLAKLLRLTEVPNLEIDGKVSGVFPIEVRNGNVEIVGGRLKARAGGGMIRYTGPSASPPPPPLGFFGRVRQRLFGKPAPAGADLAIEALRALEYKILEITVDGRISGELKVGVILEGANQQVLSGIPFKFNIKMNVPVGQFIENLDRINNINNIVPSVEMLGELDRAMRDEAAVKAVEESKTAPQPTPALPPSNPIVAPVPRSN